MTHSSPIEVPWPSSAAPAPRVPGWPGVGLGPAFIDVVIGSREAAEKRPLRPHSMPGAEARRVRGTDNRRASSPGRHRRALGPACGPRAAILADIAPELTGKTLVTLVAPLLGEREGRYVPPPGGAAALEKPRPSSARR